MEKFLVMISGIGPTEFDHYHEALSCQKDYRAAGHTADIFIHNGIVPALSMRGPEVAKEDFAVNASNTAPQAQHVGIDATLHERGTRYGDFTEHARITQNLKAALVDSPKWHTLPPSMKEALEMVAHKIGRILNGDPYYKDSWHDIIGYTRLVETELKD